MTPAITARFNISYETFRLNVDLSLPGRGVTVLFGESGSGKTTLLRCMAGLQQAPQGFLQINDLIWQDSARSLFVPTHKRALGYVFQEANLFPHLSVLGNLQFGLKRSGQKGADLTPILELLGITHLLSRMPDRLSGGERQRVAIARALALEPAILLMDEPLAALDSQRKQEILPYLSRLHQTLHIPLLYVTHSQQEVAQLADYLVMLQAGEVIAQGSLADTLSRLDLPGTPERDAATVWPVVLVGHESEYRLSQVAFAGGTLSLPYIDQAIGSPLRVQIHARDVSIALTAPSASSILNVLPATLTDMRDHQNGQTLLRLQIGEQVLLAHITRKSAVLMRLTPGMPVFAQIKATSIIN